MDQLFKELQRAIKAQDEWSIRSLQNEVDKMLFEVMAYIQNDIMEGDYVDLYNAYTD